MLNSIKSKIIFAFSVVVFIFLSLLLLISVINYNLTNSYKKINNNIILEQSLRDNVGTLIDVSYVSLNTNDYLGYYKQLNTVKVIEGQLDLIFDLNISDKVTKLAYRSVKNSLNVVLDSVEKTKTDLATNGGIIGLSKNYQNTVSQFEYVKSNIDNLLITEAKSISTATQNINSTQNLLTIVTSIVAIFVIILVLFLIIIFSRRITKPIEYLTGISKKISAGDFDVIIDKNQINEESEVGQLSYTFSLMISKVKDKIKELDNAASELAKGNLDLENSNKAVLNILEDVENEKSKVEGLANDLEKFKLAVENASDQIVITDVEGIVIYGNRAVEKITGYKAEEAMGKKAGVLWKSPMPLPYYQNLWNVIKVHKKVFVGEIQNKKKSGDLYIAIISISPVFNDNGDIIYFVAIERDITKEKEVDRAKTEFVSLASHQLRTPLSAINWYTEMLLAGDAGAINEEQRKYLDEVAIGNKRMVNLVDDLLNVSRLDMGTFIIESKPLDLPILIKSVIDESKSEILRKELVIEEKEDGDIKEFPADEKLLRMIFQNLLSNAVKYTSIKGTIKIYIAKLNRGSNFGGQVMNEDNLVFSVEDSGMGIPIYQQDRIFQKLFRADNAKESETEGTGLGLYVIKSIVDKGGGEIWFKSEENKGTTFYITFPGSGMKMKEILNVEDGGAN